MKKLVSICVIGLMSTTASAKTIWSDFSATYLNGSHYEVGDSDRQVLTLEHAAGTSWGDSFIFFDRLESDNGDTETYGEVSPRIRLTKLDTPVIKSLYFAPSAEIGDGFTNYLVGVGTDLDIPGFNYFQLNAYHRNNDNYDSNYQLTAVWAIPVGPLMYDGFMDWTNSVDNVSASMNLTSQLKYDVAKYVGLDTKLYVGVEYVYWNNKFGIKNQDERNVNLLVKYHF